MSRIGVAIIGLGIGRQHLDAVAALPQLYRVEALCDLDPDRLREQAARHAVPRTVSDFDALLSDPRIDLVSICTPPHLHRAQILAALAAGKHVVCEKPLVTSLAEFDEVSAAAAASGRRLFPIFQVRFGMGLVQLKHLQSCGLARHGLVATVETHWRREADYYAAAAWRGSWAGEHGGVCLTQAIHAHDLLTHVLGPAAKVYAQLATRVNDVEVEDCAAVSLAMAGGALASLSATLGAVDNTSRLRFVFDDLTVQSDSPNHYRPALAPWHFKGKTPAVDEAIRQALASCPAQPESFIGQFASIHATLTEGAPDTVTLADARAALELVAAIYHSAETGQAVRLPITPEHPKYACWAPAGGGFAKALAG